MGTWFPVPQAQNISLHLMGQHFGSDKMSLNATLHYAVGIGGAYQGLGGLAPQLF